MTDEQRADLGRWAIRSEKQESDIDSGVHPERPWEHMLHFPDIDAWYGFAKPADPEFWGGLTEEDLGAWYARAEFITARVYQHLHDTPSLRRRRDETGLNFEEGPSVWFMSENKAGGRALMEQLATDAERSVDNRWGSSDRLADLARAEQETLAQRQELRARVTRLTAGAPPEEGFAQWIDGQLAQLGSHDERAAWLTEFEATVRQAQAERVAQHLDHTQTAKGA